MKKIYVYVVTLGVIGAFILAGGSSVFARSVSGKGWVKGKGIASGKMVAKGQGTASGTGMAVWKDKNGHIHAKKGTGTVHGKGIVVGKVPWQEKVRPWERDGRPVKAEQDIFHKTEASPLYPLIWGQSFCPGHMDP